MLFIKLVAWNKTVCSNQLFQNLPTNTGWLLFFSTHVSDKKKTHMEEKKFRISGNDPNNQVTYSMVQEAWIHNKESWTHARLFKTQGLQDEIAAIKDCMHKLKPGPFYLWVCYVSSKEACEISLEDKEFQQEYELAKEALKQAQKEVHEGKTLYLFVISLYTLLIFSSSTSCCLWTRRTW